MNFGEKALKGAQKLNNTKNDPAGLKSEHAWSKMRTTAASFGHFGSTFDHFGHSFMHFNAFL